MEYIYMSIQQKEKKATARVRMANTDNMRQNGCQREDNQKRKM